MSKLRLTLLLLAPFVLATIVVTTAALLSILSPVVTSSPLEDIIDDEYSLNTTNGTGVAAVRDLLQDWFHTSFEQGWRNSSMMEFQPETSSQDAQEALFNTNDLVFVATNGPLSPPATKISSNSSAQHFGVVVFPIIASSLVVIHSSKAREDLVLNAELLKDILIGKITHWADKRIAQLNPQSAKQLLSSKNDTIKVFLPIEMSLTSHPLIKFLASSNINSNDAAAAHEISVAIRSAASPITLIKTGAALPSYLSDVPNAFGIVDASFIHTSYSLDNVFKAKILNSKGKAVLPTGSNGIVAAMQNTATTITASVALHENTPLIIDASDEHAYPLSTLFYISLRKDYLVNATQSSEYIDGFCDKVRRLVWFWKESLEKRKQEPFLTFDISLGFVPLSDELSASALQALGLITCNER